MMSEKAQEKSFFAQSLSTYEGCFHKDKQHGYGKFVSGTSEISTWELGLKTAWKAEEDMLTRNGTVYEGTFHNNVIEGEGTTTSTNGDVYQGGYKNEKMDGQGTFTWADGSSYTGTWLDGTFHGLGVMKTTNGDTYEGRYEMGEKHGKGKYTWRNGATYTGDYVKGFSHWSRDFYLREEWHQARRTMGKWKISGGGADRAKESG